MTAAIPATSEAAEPQIRLAFLEIIRRLVARFSLKSLEQWITQGRYDEVGRSALTEARLSPLAEAIRNAYKDGGEYGATQLARVRFVFNLRNPVAEAWLREHSSQLVTRIIADQLEAIRETVANGTLLGRNPRQTALDIAGRVSAQTGRRTGGIVGLTSPQVRFVNSARVELLSGDPTLLRNYLTRVARDKRFDRTVLGAINSGKPLSRATVDRIVGRYADRLLKVRADTIARTEALTAFNTARDESFRQAIEAGTIQAQDVTKTWKSAADSRVRDSHRTLNGQKRKMSELFQSPTGALMRFPGDTSINALGADTIQCRCIASYKIDFIGAALRGV